MRRVLNILVEGQTEREFVSSLLQPYLSDHGINNIRPITIETSPGFKGGDVSYSRYRQNITRILKGREEMRVTSMIDYYRLRSDFPGYNESRRFPGPEQKVEFIEMAVKDDINDQRFIPYIQLHEFESLLFSSERGFITFFSDLEKKNLMELVNTVSQYPNPELINDNPNTAPSVRLMRMIPNYQKPLFGNLIALENGIHSILSKCPRFSIWLERLVKEMLD